jgi:hypothetical protein
VDRVKRLLSKKISFIVLGIVVVLGVVGYIIAENNRMQNIRDDIDSYYLQKELDELLSKPSTFDLQIQSGWTTRKSGNYTYIEGSVKNISDDKTISYYKITARFYDSSGNVIDSDWTNGSQDLRPGDSVQFDIMHEYDYRVSDIKLVVDEVS